eukprot:gene10819-22569_t
MSTAEDRRRAREAYEATLAKQRQDTSKPPDIYMKPAEIENTTSAGINRPSLSQRDKMLEERRQQFIQKQNGGNQQPDRSSGNRLGASNNPTGPGQSNSKHHVEQPSSQQSRPTDHTRETIPPVEKNTTGKGRTDVPQPSNYEKGGQAERNTNHAPIQKSPTRDSAHNPVHPNPEIYEYSQPDDKAIKRAKQEEYARQLGQQERMAGAQRQGQDRGRYQEDNNQAYGGSAIGGVDDKAAKRAKQEEYARQLEQQERMAGAQRQGQDRGRYQEDNNQAYGVSAIGGVDDKAIKRAKQEEYARQLGQQARETEQSKRGLRSNGRGGDGGQSPYSPRGGLREGWIIGPLGLPVRSTIAVGNRAVQRAYNNTSPTRPSPVPVDDGFYLDTPGGRSVKENYDRYPEQPHTQIRLDGAGGVNRLMDVVDDRAAKARQLQASLMNDLSVFIEQSRALEAQIQDKKQRLEQEAKKREADEIKLQEKLEKQRQELYAEQEREKALAK